MTRQSHFDPRIIGALTYFTQAILVLLFIIISPEKEDLFKVFTPSLFPFLLLVSLITSFAVGYYLKSFQVKTISISTIFMTPSIFIATILGILLFHESTSIIKLVGISGILIAIIILNYKNVSIEKK